MKYGVMDSLLSLLGIEIQTFRGEENIRKVFAEIEKNKRMREVRNLLPILQPGTRVEINIDVPMTKPVVIHYFCEEKQAREEILRLAKAQ